MEYELVRKVVEMELRLNEMEMVVAEMQQKIFPERFKEKERR